MTEDRGDDRKVPLAVRFPRIVWRERPYSGGPPAHLQLVKLKPSAPKVENFSKEDFLTI